MDSFLQVNLRVNLESPAPCQSNAQVKIIGELDRNKCKSRFVANNLMKSLVVLSSGPIIVGTPTLT